METQAAVLSRSEADALVVEHCGWAESIARSVARAWNMDWKLDGLDGAAMEALIFCARRFQPERGVPFKGYARKRIHEASTEAARKSRGWRSGGTPEQREEQRAREVSAELLQIFPELRDGELPSGGDDGGGGDDVRGSIRELLVGASIVAAKQGTISDQPDDLVDIKRTVMYIANLDLVHQVVLYKIYWEGLSMRSVAAEWETDELNIIREHKVLLGYLQKCMSKGKSSSPPKLRPGLKGVALKLKRDCPEAPFERFISPRANP
jgi:DNA-directed RNA polymerase specialized sigma subunit